MSRASHESEVERGERFEFGRNWRSFARLLSPERTDAAERSLRSMLGRERLDGVRFLDIGCGSGLFSLAARRLGAEVESLDYDPESVACTRLLKKRFRPDDDGWIVREASILEERATPGGSGGFDIVYSWGVLHHTGAMWRAVENTAAFVRSPDGMLFISIYNRHWTSPVWLWIKRLYNKAPTPLKTAMALLFCGVFLPPVLWTMLRRSDRRARGMDYRHDVVDWLGGYPYEYASISEVREFVGKLGFDLVKVQPTSGWTGCNEFVFRHAGR